MLLLIIVIVILLLGTTLVDLALIGTLDVSSLYYPLGVAAAFILIHLLIRRFLPQADPLLFPICAALTSIGLVMIYRLDPNLSLVQLLWVIVALGAMALVILLLKNYEWLAQYKYTLGVVALLLLASTMVFGKELNGAKLWLQIGPLHFQPSEIAKIFLVIFLAAYFDEKRELLTVPTKKILGIPMPDLKYFGPLITMWGFSILIMIFQKDLGSSLLFFGIFIAMMYVATSRKAYVVVGLALFILGAYICYLSFSHVELRVVTWLHPFNPATVQNESYQISQSLFALSNGGIMGSGLGLGNPTFIPSVTTDFIFSSIGEELGLFGAASVILLYLLFTARGIKVALRQKVDFGKLLAVGLVSVIALQSFIIMGGVTGLIPLTGITLPFVSYGGSSLLANYIILGLILIISHKGASEMTRRRGKGALE